MFAFCLLHFELEMEIPLDIWLRGDVHATSHVISVATREPGRWTDDDVTAVLVGMLRALEQAKNPEADENRPGGDARFQLDRESVRRRRRGDRARVVTRCGRRRTLRRRGARLDRDDSASDGRGTCGDAQQPERRFTSWARSRWGDWGKRGCSASGAKPPAESASESDGRCPSTGSEYPSRSREGMRVPPRRRRLAPGQPEIQHIPVGPSRIRLKPLCIQHFRGGSSVQSDRNGRAPGPPPSCGCTPHRGRFRASKSIDSVIAIRARDSSCRTE